MIYLEQIVNQILMEEGQTIVTLKDLQISWQNLEDLFIGIYQQSKDYIAIYDWVEDTWGLEKQKRPGYTHIRHITFNAYNGMQRFMPDYQGNYWEFNPYTKNANSLINTNFSIEAGKHPTLANLDYETELQIKKEQPTHFILPCTFNPEDFHFSDFAAYPHHRDKDLLILESEHGVGTFDQKTLRGKLTMDIDFKGTLSVVSKYVGIVELEMTCELFYVWFKAALMQYLGAMKKQLDLTGVGLPFDINADGLLERGRQLMDRVEELKGTKQHWSNF